MELIPTIRNSPANKDCRKQHALWLQEQHGTGARFCYVDECVFSLYIARNRGQSLRGLPARRVADNQRTPHVTLLCAICPNDGLVHSKVIFGGAKQADVDGFISGLFTLSFGLALEASSNNTVFIVLDNAPCHRGIENRLQDLIPPHIQFKRLPPYSCELNPIELCFQSVKAYIKRTLSVQGPIIPMEDQTLVNASREKLLQICPNALAKITPSTCLYSFFHVLIVIVQKALRLEYL